MSRLTQGMLDQFTGTELWYRHGLVRSVTYTDGVKFFADAAGAYWLLDILATELLKFVKREGFLHIVLDVQADQASITADDGNSKVLWRRNIPWTDCPEGRWRFFFEGGGPEDTFVIMLPAER